MQILFEINEILQSKRGGSKIIDKFPKKIEGFHHFGSFFSSKFRGGVLHLLFELRTPPTEFMQFFRISLGGFLARIPLIQYVLALQNVDELILVFDVWESCGIKIEISVGKSAF